jgi:hypothetical protein
MKNSTNYNNFVFTEYGAKRDITAEARVQMYKDLIEIMEKLNLPIEKPDIKKGELSEDNSEEHVSEPY